jgi:hypothetical protein
MWTGLSLLRTGFIIRILRKKKDKLQERGNFFINSSPNHFSRTVIYVTYTAEDVIDQAVNHIRNKFTFQKLYTWRQTCNNPKC